MSRRAPRLAALALLVCCLGGLGACRGSGAAPAPKRLTIAWVSKSLGNPVFDMGRRGALQKARELSAGGPYEVVVLPVGPVAADAVEQARMLDDLIARRVDGIAVSCNDPTACIAPVNRAVAAGIPVMTWDSDAPASQRFSFLSVDNYRAGQQAADLLMRALGGQGKLAVLTGVPGALNLDERVRGFKDRLATAYPDARVVTIVSSNEDINLSVRGVEETMQAHPDMRGWFFVGMWPLLADRGAMPLWERATRERGMRTVAFDTLPIELNLLRDGYLEALIGQKYWGWGYNSVQMVYDTIVSGRRFPPFLDTGVDVVTRANVDAMARAWETGDFSQPIPTP